MKKIRIISIIALVILLVFCFNVSNVRADKLDDTITEQLEIIDLSELKDYYEKENLGEEGFSAFIEKLIKGELSLDFTNLFEYLFKTLFKKVYEVMPIFLSIIAIVIFSSVINNLKSSFLGDSTQEIVFYVSFLSIILILSSTLIMIFSNVKNTIEKLTKLSEIMSPIITTLMVASGGNGSIGIFKPAVVFISSGVSQIFSSLLLPLVIVITILSVVGNLNNTIKLKKLSESFSGILKWVIGLIVVIFGIFITTAGISAFSSDGIRIKATKYLISTGVPIIGGFLRDGFDLVIAGSVIIKNAVGVTLIFVIFYTVISEVLFMAAFSVMIKLTASFIEPLSDSRLTEFCISINKSISYLIALLLSVAFMMFLTVLLTILSVGAV